MELIGYCRTSTINQKKDETIEIQERAIKEYCRKESHKLAKVFCDDGISGGLEERPALAELFDYLETQKADAVVILKLDRLARDLYIQEHLIRKLEALGVKLISISEPDLDGSDAMRKAFRQFMGIVAELEKSFIVFRLSSGRLNKARKGFFAGGGIPIGYKGVRASNGLTDIAIDEKRAGVVRQIFQFKAEKLSLHDIATKLNDAGIPSARGGKWYAGTIRYILGNKIYQGETSYKDIKHQKSNLIINQ